MPGAFANSLKAVLTDTTRFSDIIKSGNPYWFLGWSKSYQLLLVRLFDDLVKLSSNMALGTYIKTNSVSVVAHAHDLFLICGILESVV